MPNALTTILSGLLIAVATSVLTVWLALWRFHSEKWWERKAELYSKLIEALYDMYCYDRDWLDDYEADHEYESPEQEQQRKARLAERLARHAKGEEEVQKIAIIGSFIVSDAVAADIMQMRKRYNAAMGSFREDGIYDIVGECMEAVKECLGHVREHAKEDLGITRRLPPFLEKVGAPTLSVLMKLTGR